MEVGLANSASPFGLGYAAVGKPGLGLLASGLALSVLVPSVLLAQYAEGRYMRSHPEDVAVECFTGIRVDYVCETYSRGGRALFIAVVAAPPVIVMMLSGVHGALLARRRGAKEATAWARAGPVL